VPQQVQNKAIGMAEFMATYSMYEAENLLSKKCSQYAEQVTDPQLKSMCQEFSREASNKANRLSSILMESGGGQYVSS